MKQQDTSVIEIPAACNRMMMTAYFFLSGMTGFFLIRADGALGGVLGGGFLVLFALIGWQLISHPRWQISLSTGQLRRIRNIRVPIFSHQDTPLSIQEYVRLHMRIRVGVGGMWDVILSNSSGKELLIAPCVGRERGEEIARLLSERFGLKNDTALG